VEEGMKEAEDRKEGMNEVENGIGWDGIGMDWRGKKRKEKERREWNGMESVRMCPNAFARTKMNWHNPE
jgi:hypothetical protein